MSKWAVLTLWTPYEIFDTKEAAAEYAALLERYSGIYGFVVEDE